MGWVQAVYENHRFLYAVMTVSVLLVVGGATGMLMEKLLEVAGLETEELDHEE